MFTTRTRPKAKKEYRCYFCREAIRKGDIYVRQFAVGGSGDSPFISKSHPECDEYACAHWDDGDWECFCPGDEFERPALTPTHKPVGEIL